MSDTANFPNPLLEVNVWDKIKGFQAEAERILRRPFDFLIPVSPGRDVEVWGVKDHPPKPGLSLKEGRARLLHDLASIELQAFELGVRTLLEYPDAPKGFREELMEVTLEDSRHLRLCLEGLERLGFAFGDWPVHLSLWNSVGKEDSLLDRVLIVHRYLEGSGLDASELILERLTGVEDKAVEAVVKVIAEEEIGHVLFGSRWYGEIAKANGVDPSEDFGRRLLKLKHKIPRRLEPISRDLRIQAGFSEREIFFLERVQGDFREELKSRLG